MIFEHNIKELISDLLNLILFQIKIFNFFLGWFLIMHSVNLLIDNNSIKKRGNFFDLIKEFFGVGKIGG